MLSPRDERLNDLRRLRDRVRLQPEKVGSSLGELHPFLMELYESAAQADGNAEGFAKALTDVCAVRGIDCWEDFFSEDQQSQFFKDGTDPLAQRIIAFWSELDEPLAF